METQEKTFDILRQENIWRLEQDLNGLIFMQKNNKKKADLKMGKILFDTYTIALPFILGYIVWILKNQKKDRDANSKGTMMLLRVQLIEYHDKYMRLGYIPTYAYQNFVEMYDAYHAMGGNGLGTQMYEDIKTLDIRNLHREEIEG